MRLPSYQCPKSAFQASAVPSCRNTLMGLGSVLRTILGRSLPPRMPTKVPTPLNTRPHCQGRCHAAVKAAMPPLLKPNIARSWARPESFITRPSGVTVPSMAGSTSRSRKVAKTAVGESNS